MGHLGLQAGHMGLHVGVRPGLGGTLASMRSLRGASSLDLRMDLKAPSSCRMAASACGEPRGGVHG